MLGPGSRLEPARDQLEVFIDAIFRHAGSGFVSLRAFYESEDKTFRITPTSMAGGFRFLADAAEDDARRAAQYPQPIVFCPPLALFNNKDRAREADIAEGLALSVECDQAPTAAREELERLIGPATVVVRSGGIWVDQSGHAHDKLHLHWRLARPASGEHLATLKATRNLAARVVGGDTSNVPVCHCIRWPGSWHRKAEPRLCEIIAVDPDREIELATAFAILSALAPRRAETSGGASESEPVADDDKKTITELVRGILSGETLHPAIIPLSARLIGYGTSKNGTVAFLRALMELSKAPHDDGRWGARYAAIPADVESAFAKFGKQTEQAAPSGLGEWNAGQDTKTPPPRGWLLGNTFARKYLSSLLADGAVGKTALRITQAAAAATGRAITGEHIFVRSRVLIVSLEDDGDELRRRVLATCLHHKVPREELAGWLFLAAPGASAGKLMTTDKNGTIMHGKFAEHLEEVIVRLEIDIVILDPFVKTHSVEENHNSAIDDVAQLLTDLAAKHDVAIDAPHHTSKGTADPGNASRGRGASSLVDA